MSYDDSLKQRFWAFCVEPTTNSKLLRKARYLCLAHKINAFCSGEDLLHNVLIEAASKLQPDKTEGDWEAWLFTLLGHRADDQKRRPVNQNILSAGKDWLDLEQNCLVVYTKPGATDLIYPFNPTGRVLGQKIADQIEWDHRRIDYSLFRDREDIRRPR